MSTPKIRRRSGGKIVAGVAGGIADHLGVEVFAVRVVFVVLAALGGAGVFGYAALWFLCPPGDDTERPTAAQRRQAWGLILIGAIAMFAWMVIGTGTRGQDLVGLLVVLGGAALVWREFDITGSRGGSSLLTWLRLLIGAVLVIGGLVAVVTSGDAWGGDLSRTVLSVVATLIGVVVLTVPLWMRMLRALDDERAARIRDAEREEIASHLHDSVLQTLALIQKQAGNPDTVVRLARGQERELRSWLFGDSAAVTESLAAAIADVGAQVESDYGLEVETVTVGDLGAAELGDPVHGRRWGALLGATREALVNAAKHSGAEKADVYVEISDDRVEVFIRDRGSGFDMAAVDPGRQGIVGSIQSRMQRAGGTAEVTSTVGRGTNVVLALPRTAQQGAPVQEDV